MVRSVDVIIDDVVSGISGDLSEKIRREAIRGFGDGIISDYEKNKDNAFYESVTGSNVHKRGKGILRVIIGPTIALHIVPTAVKVIKASPTENQYQGYYKMRAEELMDNYLNENDLDIQSNTKSEVIAYLAGEVDLGHKARGCLLLPFLCYFGFGTVATYLYHSVTEAFQGNYIPAVAIVSTNAVSGLAEMIRSRLSDE